MVNYSTSNNSLLEDLIHVNRVTKVVKGGRNFSFAAIVVVGDESGRVGYGTGKAKEVAEAKLKATENAKRNMILVSLYQGRTIHHDVVGKSGAAKVILMRAPVGTGVIAGGPLRYVFARLGVQDIVAKSLGSANTQSMIAATINALATLRSPKVIADRRGKTLDELSAKSVKFSKK